MGTVGPKLFWDFFLDYAVIKTMDLDSSRALEMSQKKIFIAVRGEFTSQYYDIYRLLTYYNGFEITLYILYVCPIQT